MADADVLRLQPGPLAPDLPQSLDGLVNPIAMERLAIDPYGPALSGDLLTLDLAGPIAHLAHRAVPLHLVRHRERSDGSWMAIDRMVLGEVRGALHHAVALRSEVERRQAIASAPVGFVAAVVTDASTGGAVLRVAPIGRNRVGVTSDAYAIPAGLSVEALRLDSRGSARLVLANPADGSRRVVVTHRDAETEALAFNWRIDAGRWDIAWTSGASPVCGGFACVGVEQSIEAFGIAHADALPITDRRLCGVDDGLVIASLRPAVGERAANAPSCEPLPVAPMMARCVSGGGRIDFQTTHLDARDGARGGRVVTLGCADNDGGEHSAVLARDLDGEHGWRRILETDRAQRPVASAVALDDGCQALRVAAHDSATGPILIDIPLGACADDAPLAMRALPTAMAGQRGERLTLRSDGLVPERGLVHDLRAPGKASCELGGEGETPPLCVDAMTGGTRVLRNAATFQGATAGSWVVATLSADARRDFGAGAGVDGPRVRFGASQTALLGLDSAGRLRGRSDALPATCEQWTVVGDRLVGACRDGIRAFDLKYDDVSGSHVGVFASARWPVLPLERRANGAAMACGANPPVEAAPCPTLTHDAATPAFIHAHRFDGTPGRETLHALKFAPNATPDGASLGFESIALGPLGSSDVGGDDATLAHEVTTTSIDGRLHTIIALSRGARAHHDVIETVIVALNGSADSGLKADIMRRRTVPHDGASRVSPVGVAVVGFKRDGTPRRALVGVVTDHSARLPDEETGARRNGPTNLDTVAITSLEPCDTRAALACHWSVTHDASPFAPLVRAPGAGLPASVALGRPLHLADMNGDGLTDLVVDVAADDAVALAERRTQLLVADGRGGFNASRSAAPEIWSMPNAIGRHGPCELPVLVTGEGLALFGVEPSDGAACAKPPAAGDM